MEVVRLPPATPDNERGTIQLSRFSHHRVVVPCPLSITISVIGRSEKEGGRRLHPNRQVRSVHLRWLAGTQQRLKR